MTRSEDETSASMPTAGPGARIFPWPERNPYSNSIICAVCGGEANVSEFSPCAESYRTPSYVIEYVCPLCKAFWRSETYNDYRTRNRNHVLTIVGVVGGSIALGVFGVIAYFVWG